MGKVIGKIAQHEAQSGTSAKGAWIMHLFTMDDGTKLQTFDKALGSKALTIMGQDQYAEINFNPTPRGDFINNVIQTVEVADAGYEPAPIPQDVPVSQVGEPDRRQRTINLSAGIARAIELSVATGEPIESLDDLFDVADIIAHHLNTLGEDRKRKTPGVLPSAGEPEVPVPSDEEPTV